MQLLKHFATLRPSLLLFQTTSARASAQVGSLRTQVGVGPHLWLKRTANFHSTSHTWNNSKQLLITTPIFYVNSSPHIGHLYTSLVGDVLARWRRMKGEKTLFITGTDEHGLKIQQAAEKKCLSPFDFCSKVSTEFKDMAKKAQISYDDFIRTTEDRHKAAVNHLWNTLASKGEIYLGKYEGWYCVSDESFVPEDQVIEVINDRGEKRRVSSESGHPVEWLTEENYKFRLSKYQKPLLDWLENNPGCIVPVSRYNEVKSLVERGLADLSVSRVGNRIKWGISVPNDPKHTIYVWLDALTNYLTVTGYPDPSFKNTWPPEYHVIGKDILKFHAVYWPAFLMAAGLELPKKIISHAHWTVNKVKMSKSLGNVVCPNQLIDTYCLDPVRYFLLSEGGLVEDGGFSHERLMAKLKGELADTYGNLVARCTSASLNPNNVLPHPSLYTEEDRLFIDTFQQLPQQVDAAFTNGEISKGILATFTAIHQTNKYIYQNQPWKLKPKKSQIQSEENLQRFNTIMYNCLEAIRISSLLLHPVMPSSMDKVLDRLGVSESERTFEHCKFGERTPGVALGQPMQFHCFTIPDIQPEPAKLTKDDCCFWPSKANNNNATKTPKAPPAINPAISLLQPESLIRI